MEERITDSQEQILEGLNEGQRQAVTHGEGPLLIIAGAGTGKTAVITKRIAYLIATKKARPEEILALTFTEKAAEEMTQRVDILVPYGFVDVWISTFHALGDRILRENALALGLPPDFRILTPAEQVIFMREHLFELPLDFYRPLGNPLKHLRGILILISRAKDEDVTPNEYLAFAEKLVREAEAHPGDAALQERARQQMELALTYQKYQALLAANGKLDFGDLITLTLRLFREHPLILRRYQERFRYILVDEFQDTNYAQLQLVRLLASRYRNLTVVGDDDQAIFRFRGASFSNILVFLKEYPDAQKIVLSENYRSTQPILDAAYRLIQHNNPDRLEVEAGIDKRLMAKTCPERSRRDGNGSPVRYKVFGTYEDEADWVAEQIAEKVKEGLPYREFAILVRRNADADPFIRSLNMKGIPWRFSGSRGLYNREEIRTVIAFLRALADPHDSKSLYHLAVSEVYGMPAMDLTLINSFAARKHRSLFEILRKLKDDDFEEVPELSKVSGLGRAAAKRLIEDLDYYIERAVREPTGSVLYEYLVKQPGYVKRLAQSSSFQDHQKVANIAKFFEIVRRFGEVASYDRVAHFVEYLDQLIEAGEDPATAEFDADEDAVHILTLHKAKGLEFAVVFLVGLVHNRFPSPDRGDPIPLPDELIKAILPKGDFHLEEERRLFYVGMTRAEQVLYLTRARDYGTKREWKPSPFILEALDLPKAPEELIRASAQAAIDRSAPLPDPAEGGSYAIPADQPLELSYYKIDDYLTCPLKYWYTHIQRMERILRRHHTVIYGSAIHQAVREYHVRKVQGERMGLEDLYAAFLRVWQSEGFISRKHEEERLRAGREALARFYEHAEAEEAAPTHIERKFRFKLENDWIIGYWDRVDEREGEVVIIDYKTSELREQKKADEETRQSPQLSIYALAYRERFGRLPDWVELRFLTPWGVLVGRAVKKERDLEKTIEKIREASIGIRSGRFPAKPSEWVCRFCAYQSICPATAWKEVGV